MGLSKKEVLELLAPKSKEEVELILGNLGFKPEEQEYPEDIVEQVEECFGLVDNKVKQLSGSEKQDAIAVQESASMVQQQLVSHNISIPVESLMYLLQNSIKEAQMAASVINEAAIAAFNSELEQGQRRFARGMSDAAQASGLRLEQIFSPQTVQKMVAAAVPIEEDVDVDKFLASSRRMQERRAMSMRQSSANAASKQTVEVKAFDIDAFIKKVN